jgi:hypothetical protein
MRPIGNAVGALLILLGVVWLLQEYDIISGDIWSQAIPWPHRGLIAICAGVVFVFAINRGEH